MSRERVKLARLLPFMLVIYSFSENVPSSGVYPCVLNHFSETSGDAFTESARRGDIFNFVHILWESGDCGLNLLAVLLSLLFGKGLVSEVFSGQTLSVLYLPLVAAVCKAINELFSVEELKYRDVPAFRFRGPRIFPTGSFHTEHYYINSSLTYSKIKQQKLNWLEADAFISEVIETRRKGCP